MGACIYSYALFYGIYENVDVLADNSDNGAWKLYGNNNVLILWNT